MSQVSEQRIVEAHYYADCSPDQVEEVLAHLDRWSDRNATHVTHNRHHERHEYRTEVIVERLHEGNDAPDVRQIFHVQARNVSRVGLGFLAPPVFVPKLVSDATPLLRTDDIFEVGASVTVKLNAADRDAIEVCATVMRRRPVQFGFFEIGLKFTGRSA